MKDGDRPTSTFLVNYKRRGSSTDITELLDESGQVCKDWDGMANIANSFFKNLLTTDGRQHSKIIQEVLQELDIRISEEDRRNMETPFQLDQELQATTFALAKGRRP